MSTLLRTTSALSTGSVPGWPMHTGHTCELGTAPYADVQPQNALVRVPSCTCTSRPHTVSHSTAACAPPECARGLESNTSPRRGCAHTHEKP